MKAWRTGGGGGGGWEASRARAREGRIGGKPRPARGGAAGPRSVLGGEKRRYRITGDMRDTRDTGDTGETGDTRDIGYRRYVRCRRCERDTGDTGDTGDTKGDRVRRKPSLRRAGCVPPPPPAWCTTRMTPRTASLPQTRTNERMTLADSDRRWWPGWSRPPERAALPVRHGDPRIRMMDLVQICMSSAAAPSNRRQRPPGPPWRPGHVRRIRAAGRALCAGRRRVRSKRVRHAIRVSAAAPRWTLRRPHARMLGSAGGPGGASRRAAPAAGGTRGPLWRVTVSHDTL